MIARGITPDELDKAATEAGVLLDNPRKEGRGTRFTLRLAGELWRRYSPSGRKVAAVCFHGHARFMQEVFAINPETTLITAMERFDGVEEFTQNACAVGERNAGSMYQPSAYAELCRCDGSLAEAKI